MNSNLEKFTNDVVENVGSRRVTTRRIEGDISRCSFETGMGGWDIEGGQYVDFR